MFTIRQKAELAAARWRALCGAGLLAAPWAALAGQPFPTPGLYRVDMVGTQSASAGGTTASQQTTVQGATGNTTATQRVTGLPAVAAGTYAGKAPVTVCVKPSSDPTAAMAAQAASGCKLTPPQPRVEGDTARFGLQCPSLEQDLQSRRLDDTTWEWRITTRFKTQGAGTLPPATAAAMAPAIAQIEARLRQQPQGAEADGMRKALAAMQGSGSAAATGQQNTVVQRYTRIAESCS